MTRLHRLSTSLFAIVLILVFSSAAAAQNYKNFKVAVYAPISVTQKMKDPAYLAATWEKINKGVKIDKIYLETQRSHVLLDEDTIEKAKQFFLSKGVQVAGGMAYSGGGEGFESFCYTDPQDRAYAKRASELTARHFDEIILDDFFFYNTKRESDIVAKGDRSWTQFRLETMDEVAKDLLVDPAKAVNPKVKYVIKYPNWYEFFAQNGFDLEREPKIFDGIYTGTETRDPIITDQQLQAYESYSIIRYFDNIAPGRNGGGWVDTFDIRYVDRYPEQLWETMFAKAPEITLFFYGGLLEPAPAGDRAAWADAKTSFDFNKVAAAAGDKPIFADVAGDALRQVDEVVGKLGNPIAIHSYKPYQSTDGDSLVNFIGMIGLPVEITPKFPAEDNVILLTESAAHDPQIVSRIEKQLRDGKNVVVTSGLFRLLQGKGIEDIVEASVLERKLSVSKYVVGPGAGEGRVIAANDGGAIDFPEVSFATNDAWSVVRGLANDRNVPLLVKDRYGKGTLYIWVMPENPQDLYRIPQMALTIIKTIAFGGDRAFPDFPVRIDAPSRVSLFPYDNHTFVVESFRPTASEVRVSVEGGYHHLRNLATGERITDSPLPQNGMGFVVKLPPHSFAAFAEEK